MEMLLLHLAECFATGCTAVRSSISKHLMSFLPFRPFTCSELIAVHARQCNLVQVVVAYEPFTRLLGIAAKVALSLMDHVIYKVLRDRFCAHLRLNNGLGAYVHFQPKLQEFLLTRRCSGKIVGVGLLLHDGMVQAAWQKERLSNGIAVSLTHFVINGLE